MTTPTTDTKRLASRVESGVWTRCPLPKPLPEDVRYVVDANEARSNGIPYDLQPHVVQPLRAGDYSVQGVPILIERKSYSDLLSCMGVGRERFKDQVRRLHESESQAHLVAEVSLSRIAAGRFDCSRIHPNSVLATIRSWSVRFPGCRWWFADSRKEGQHLTEHLLRVAYWEHVET